MTSLCERQVRYVVRGYTAGWVKHGLDPQEDQAKAGISVSDSAFGVEPSTSWGVLTTPEGSQATPAENGRYIDFFANLVDAINGVAPVAVKPEEAANVIRVLELLGRSEREGKVLAVPRV